jgi:hypothetical protein
MTFPLVSFLNYPQIILMIDLSHLLASFTSTYECFETEVEEPQYNYQGPKIVLPKCECPITIFTADTIGMVKSRQLLQVLLDSDLMVSMIKRSALLPKVITKTMSKTWNIPMLTEKIQAQEVSLRIEVARSLPRTSVSVNKRL